MIDKDKIPEEVLKVLDKLNESNYEGYLVGGCVRDSLLNKQPKDWDITTNATPEQIQKIFNKTIPTGIKHGTVTAIENDMPIEITTFRIDGQYNDNRHPDSVLFTSNLKDDLSRRDFTINAIAYNNKKGIVDEFNGIEDLKNKKIVAVGNAEDRFKEDSLRMLRAIRFACQLNFSIDAKTLVAIPKCSGLIVNVSQERIREELNKIILSDYPMKGIKLLKATKLLDYILPELCECYGFDQHNPHHSKNVFDHILKVLESTPKILNCRLAALLHDIAKPKSFTMGEDGVGHFFGHHLDSAEMARDILTRFKYDNKTIENVCILVKEHMSRYPKLRQGNIKKLINRVGIDNLEDLFNLQIADIIGSIPPYDFTNVLDLRNEVNRILNEKEPFNIKDLAINGHDLIELGMKPGIEMGRALNGLLEKVIEEPSLNTKEKLIELVKGGN